MSDTTLPTPTETQAAPEPGATSPLRRMLYWIVGVIAAWGVLAVAVLFWQPGRFIQLGVAIVAVLATVMLPKNGLHKALWLLAAAVSMVVVFYAPSWLLSSEIEFTIRAAEREADKGVYLVHTDYGAKAIDDPGETFRNQDSPLFWKVNSSDLIGVFEANKQKRMRARVIGIRFADRSLYRNIITVKVIDP